MLVRDLHAPKVSELKRAEMQKLIDRVENKRISRQLPIVSRSPNKLDSERKQMHKSYLSSGLKKDGMIASTQSLSKVKSTQKMRQSKIKKINKALTDVYNSTKHDDKK